MTKRLNFIPQDARASRAAGSSPSAFSVKPSLLIALVVAAAAAVAIPRVIRQVRTSRAGSGEPTELRRLKAELQAQSQAAEEHLASDKSALKLQQAELDLKRKGLSKAQRPSVPLSKVLSSLAGVVPENVFLTKLTYTAKTLTITGSSDDAGAATQLMDKLEASGQFWQTTFGYAKRASHEKGSSANKSHAFVFEISTLPVLGSSVKDHS